MTRAPETKCGSKRADVYGLDEKLVAAVRRRLASRGMFAARKHTMKRIADFMTPQPWTVQLDDSLGVARRMMAEREIHHLPVLDRSDVVGIVKDLDLTLAGDHLGTVADVLMPVHPVTANTPLGDVLDLMSTNRWDAVVVTEDGHVTGIFTSSDAVRMLAEVVRERAA